jgi:hypothetical protein
VIDQIKNLFRDTTPLVRFSCIHGAYNYSPVGQIRLAADLKFQPDWLKNQKTYDNSKNKFLNCPGMADFMKAGYIIPAWENIKIKANTADTVVLMEKRLGSKNDITPMNPKLVDGIAPVESSVKLKVTKIPTPWGIFTKSGYSAYVLPAVYHSPFLKDLYVYPGIVDYDKFIICNFIFTAIRACEIEIPLGTPLLQIIPFKREDISAVCMKATEIDIDKKNFQFPGEQIKAAYRKYCHSKKTYTLENKE